MSILIATAINPDKTQPINRWLQNLKDLNRPQKTSILVVDTSINAQDVDALTKRVKASNIGHIKVKHLEIGQWQPPEEKFGRSLELIRQEFLANSFDFLLYWDTKIPLSSDALEKMLQIQNTSHYSIISHMPTTKEVWTEARNLSFGVELIKASALQRYGFCVTYPDMPNNWMGVDIWLKKRLIRDGFSLVELNINRQRHLQLFSGNKKVLKLNLGCGKKPLPGFVNIDIQKPCDLQHDLRHPLPFKDNSVDEIFSEGSVICLLSRDEWQNLKHEISRVLKPGGKLNLNFLEFDHIIQAYLKAKSPDARKWWRQALFSAQENSFDFTKNAFVIGELKADLSKEGFINFYAHETTPAYFQLTCTKEYPIDKTRRS